METMQYVFLILSFIILTLSCQNIHQSTREKLEQVHSTDTIVGKKSISNELAGGAYRTRATEYFLVTYGDTSKFSIYLTEYKENRHIGLEFKHSYFGNHRTSHQQRLDELPALLREVQKEYDLDSLRGISLNTMITNGDLAVKVTNELVHAFPEYKTKPTIKNEDYFKIFEFLKKSQLAKDLNQLFAPYYLVVDRVWGEKLHFSDKTWLYQNSVVETDSTLVPDQILDCIIGVTMKKIL